MSKNIKLKILNITMLIISSIFWGMVALGLVVNFVEKTYIYPLRNSDIINEYADAYSIDRALIYSVIKVESSFNERAQSKKGAKGLMQITERTAEFISNQLGVKEYDLLDAKTNVNFGCWYLRYLINKFTSLNTALCAYNAGEGNVLEWLKNPVYSTDKITLQNIPFGETKEYIERIEKAYHKYAKIHKEHIYNMV